jgi:hypothetical protein
LCVPRNLIRTRENLPAIVARVSAGSRTVGDEGDRTVLQLQGSLHGTAYPFIPCFLSIVGDSYVLPVREIVNEDSLINFTTVKGEHP